MNASINFESCKEKDVICNFSLRNFFDKKVPGELAEFSNGRYDSERARVTEVKIKPMFFTTVSLCGCDEQKVLSLLVDGACCQTQTATKPVVAKCEE